MPIMNENVISLVLQERTGGKSQQSSDSIFIIAANGTKRNLVTPASLVEEKYKYTNSMTCDRAVTPVAFY